MKKISIGLLATLKFSLILFAEQKPNVIYIIADDLGYGDLSCYGQKNWQTPNIDALAKEGLKFTNHYSGSTVCSPSRASLMTGLDQGHAPIRGNGNYQLEEEDFTIAEVFKQADYITGMIGKSCVTGNTQDAQAPHVSGFDYFYGTLSHKKAHHHWPKYIFENGEKVEIPGNKGKTGEVFIQNRYTDKALNFLEHNHEKPFFLLLSYSTPHADVDAPAKDVEPFLGKFGEEIAYKGGHYKRTEKIKATYAGMLANLDNNLGKITAKIKELGIEENTIVCFTSDNGPHFEGGYDPEIFDSNRELRGGKRDLYEGGIRVPFLVKWPQAVKPDTVSDHQSAFWDFMPTVCEIVGEKIPENIQGLSFLPTLKGGAQKAHPFLYWEFAAKGGKVALRQGDWKIVGLSMQERQKKFELYNLKDDISEATNITESHPEKLAELKQMLKAHRASSNVKEWNFLK